MPPFWSGSARGLRRITEHRTFRPAFNAKQISQLCDAVERGEQTIREADAFRTLSREVISHLDDFAGQWTTAMRQHGDMNLRNLIVDRETVWGIDFTRTNPVPVGCYDVPRFLLHYGTLLAEQSQLLAGWPMPEEMIAAFFTGYGFAP